MVYPPYPFNTPIGNTMQDPIQLALNRIYFKIPREILEATFTPSVRGISLDMCIINDVIHSVILADCNNGGGKLAKIPLTTENAVCLDPPIPYSLGVSNTWSVYRVLPHARENRSINAAISIRIPYSLAGDRMGAQSIMGGGITLSDIACTALNSHTHAQHISTPTPILLAGDVVKLNPPQLSHLDWILECRLAYDENFTNMDVNIIPTFGELVVAGVKAYIFNKMIFAVDRTYLSGGQELGIFKTTIESYSDQYERYEELIKQFNSVSVLEPERLRGVLAYML